MASINQTMILEHWKQTDPTSVMNLRKTKTLEQALMKAERELLDEVSQIKAQMKKDHPMTPETPYQERLAIETRLHDQAMEIVTQRFLTDD